MSFLNLLGKEVCFQRKALQALFVERAAILGIPCFLFDTTVLGSCSLSRASKSTNKHFFNSFIQKKIIIIILLICGWQVEWQHICLAASNRKTNKKIPRNAKLDSAYGLVQFGSPRNFSHPIISIQFKLSLYEQFAKC